MAHPDNSNPFAEFWKLGETSLQSGPMRIFAESMGKGFPFSPGVLDSANPHLAQSTAQFRELVETCLKLPGEHHGCAPNRRRRSLPRFSPTTP